jgi:uncharacterized protein (TIGR03089 family)
VAKTANLLVNELDAGPGSRVAIALPMHWRLACWLLATWSVGACAVLGPAAGGAPTTGPGTATTDADVLVSADPAVLAAAGKAFAVAVALPALASSYGPGLPSGAIDAATDVRAQDDVFVPPVRPVPGDLALDLPGGEQIRYGGLIDSALRAADDAGMPARVRLLTGEGPGQAIAGLLAPLVRLGSVVLHHDLAGLDPQQLDHLRSQERIS